MCSSIANWNLLSHDPRGFSFGFIDREKEIDALLATLGSPGTVLELVGPVGIGKTALLMMLIERARASFDGETEFYSGHAKWSLLDAAPEIAERYRSVQGHHLLIVDDADMLDPEITGAALSFLKAGPWMFSALVASQIGLGIGTRVPLRPIPFRTIKEFLNRSMSPIPDEGTIRRFWRLIEGRPALANIFLEQSREDNAPSLTAFIEALSPWESQGLIDPQGNPLSKDDTRTRRLIADVRGVDEEMLRRLGNDPDTVLQLSPRAFEELVAELFHRKGYEVTLTPHTRDGGRDIHAVRHDDFGSFLYLVEAKRYSRHQTVGVEVVRSLHGVTQLEQATAGIIVTTSRFSRPARELAQRIPYQMSLRDYLDLRRWLEAYRVRA